MIFGAVNIKWNANKTLIIYVTREATLKSGQRPWGGGGGELGRNINSMILSGTMSGGERSRPNLHTDSRGVKVGLNFTLISFVFSLCILWDS